MDLPEIYLPRNYFLELAGFSEDDFRIFTKTMEISQDNNGYFPVFQIMYRLNLQRKKGKWGTGDADTALKLVKIHQIKLNTAIKAKEYIQVSVAKNRIKSVLMAVANKIRYAIKIASPQLVMIQDVSAIESILTDKYNSAIEMLKQEATEVKSWEEHGLNLMSGGDQLAENSDESLSD